MSSRTNPDKDDREDIEYYNKYCRYKPSAKPIKSLSCGEKMIKACEAGSGGIIQFCDSEFLEGIVTDADEGKDLNNGFEPEFLQRSLELCYEPEYTVAAQRIRARIEVILNKYKFIIREANTGNCLENYSNSEELRNALKLCEGPENTTAGLIIQKRIDELEAGYQVFADDVINRRPLRKYHIDQFECLFNIFRRERQNDLTLDERDILIDKLNHYLWSLKLKDHARKLDKGILSDFYGKPLNRVLQFCKSHQLVNAEQRLQQRIDKIKSIVNAAKTGKPIDEHMDDYVDEHLLIEALNMTSDKKTRRRINLYLFRLESIIPIANRNGSLDGFTIPMLKFAITRCGNDPCLSETKKRILKKLKEF